ncbi:MAG: hypothetical protein GF355_07345 [Candidatus Eisenbacteria bacterium]|nr:hypothetical protein [Candidatus Latescibacterota bacterium]MBD3335317.1 hypothetical protein [Candidatus Eisenbacteria bacterium]
MCVTVKVSGEVVARVQTEISLAPRVVAELTARYGEEASIESASSTSSQSGPNPDLNDSDDAPQPPAEDHREGTGSATVVYEISSYDELEVFSTPGSSGGPWLTKVKRCNVENYLSVKYSITGGSYDGEGAWHHVVYMPPAPTSGTALVACAGIVAEAVIAYDTRGLEAETGAQPGTTEIRLDDTAPRDISFEISTSPSDSITLLDVEQDIVTVPEGSASIMFSYLAKTSGSVTIVLTELDEEEDPTAAELEAEAQFSANSSFVSTELGLRHTGNGGAHRMVGASGGVAGDVVLNRLGYDDIENESMVVSVTLDDPQDILDTFPSQLTIEQGECVVSQSLSLLNAEGEATITFSAGDQSVELTVISEDEELSAPDSIRVPLNASMEVGFDRSPPLGALHEYTFSSSNPAVLTADETYVNLVPFKAGASFAVSPEQLGSATLSVYSAGGGPSCDISALVVAPEVEIEDEVLTLANLSPEYSGVIIVVFPEGTVLAEVDLPDGAELFMSSEVSGNLVEFEISPAEEMPSTVDVDLQFSSGAPETAEIMDLYHDASSAIQYEIQIE